ncbi:hypothetical protein ACOMHN_050534 [Nucella lapillus]
MKPLSYRTEQMKAAGVMPVSSNATHCRLQANGMDSELQLYKQKTEQMTALIRHYQSELESQKVRRDGVETVSRLLSECRQENIILKKKHSALQMMVHNLQNRLTVSGVTSASEADDNEVIMPGMSKQTLTNLALENKRLRSLIQQENSSETSDSLQKTVEDTEPQKSLQQTADQLEAENRSMKRKLSDLEGLFKSSNNEKDRQLVHYQEEIQRLSKQNGEAPTSDRTTTTVSALKEQLKALMAQCATFESHLEKVRETESEPGKKEAAVELVPVSKRAAEPKDAIDGVDVRQLLEEKQKLEVKVQEVAQMNQRWQEFFNERDGYTKQLEQRVQELDSDLKKARHSGATLESHQRMEHILQKSQVEISHLGDLRKKAEEEAEQLRHDLALRDTHLSQLQSQMTILSCALQQQQSCPPEAQSTIDHLKAQIQVCTEDFEKERQDRQIALQKVASLQEQNARLQKLSSYYQTLLNQTERPAVSAHCDQEASNHFQQNRLTFGQSLLAYDGSSSPTQSENGRDFPDFDAECARRVQPYQGPGPVSLPATTMELLSRGVEKPRHSLSDSALNAESSKKDTFLTCPKCNKEFSEELQGELLAHMDMCWE